MFKPLYCKYARTLSCICDLIDERCVPRCVVCMCLDIVCTQRRKVFSKRLDLDFPADLLIGILLFVPFSSRQAKDLLVHRAMDFNQND